MNESKALVIFLLDHQKFGLFLSHVERIVRMVEISPLPKAPEMVLGVINMAGTILPVFDVRKRFNFPPREPGLNDHLIIARLNRRFAALLVDSAAEVMPYQEQKVVETHHILQGLPDVEGVMKLESGLVLIHRLDQFLSLKEELVLEEAMDSFKAS